MIIYDRYKIEIDKSDYSLWELQQAEEFTKVGKGGSRRTGKTIGKWVHIGYYGTPWNALRRILSLESFHGFTNESTLEDMLKRLNALEDLLGATIESVVESVHKEFT